MRILVAGGFGYVGGRIAHVLGEAGHTVVLGTRQAASSPAWLPQARVIQLQWQDRAALEDSCRGMDAIIHAAGMNAQDCAADPVAALEFNGVATARLVAAAVKAGVKRVVYFSTAHVYASSLEGTITEQTCPRNLHPYATSHLAGEQVVLEAAQRRAIHGTVFRLSNAFGTPMWQGVNCWMLLVNDLCRQAVTTGELTLRSAGLQLRDFLTLEDVARAVLHVLPVGSDCLGDGLFNLGGGAAAQSILSMTELVAERWKSLTGQSLPIVRPAPAGPSPSVLAYSSAKLLATGFSPSSRWPHEIDETLALCRAAFGR
ncbi:MAG: SDR family oxidoreductase [Acidimicrobiia bacterium]|nr:SDR family oxidoreductase [Acidimicrobiia bacterium]